MDSVHFKNVVIRSYEVYIKSWAFLADHLALEHPEKLPIDAMRQHITRAFAFFQCRRERGGCCKILCCGTPDMRRSTNSQMSRGKKSCSARSCPSTKQQTARRYLCCLLWLHSLCHGHLRFWFSTYYIPLPNMGTLGHLYRFIHRAIYYPGC
jgi:hypothetical protein